MPSHYLRPAISALRTARNPSLSRPSANSRISHSYRCLTTTSSRRAGDAGEHHEDHFDPPGGWLWGEPPGTKYQKEGWENIMYYGFFGGLIVFVIAYAFKPDTRYVHVIFQARPCFRRTTRGGNLVLAPRAS